MPRPFMLEIKERNLPPEWDGVVPEEAFIEEAIRIADEARRRGFPLKLIGGVAIWLHCSELLQIARSLPRPHTEPDCPLQQRFKDIDLVASRAHRKEVTALFASLGYIKRPVSLALAEADRHVYFHPLGWFEVDVFFGGLKMEHTLNLEERLEADHPTVHPSDLLLSKLLITRPTLKDLQDMWLLLRAHQVATQEAPETLCSSYIARQLASDWGFWYDALSNLERLRSMVQEGWPVGKRDEELLHRLQALQEALEQEPKAFRWKMRSLLGTRVRWFRVVEELT